MTTNWLARFFDWLGEIFERFNPSAFRFLAATLPYLTPLPVAWLTSYSASEFLHFPPTIAFVFVFALEGIGLWFTSMLVDAVVEWVRSRNWRSFVPVLMFAVVVFVYVRLLIDLNVTLEAANGVANPSMSRVITLMCYLPLITGVGNGYYKLKLEHKTQVQVEQQRQFEREEKRRQDDEAARIRKEHAEGEERIRQARLTAHLEQLRLEAEARAEQAKANERLEKYRLRMEKANGHRPNEPVNERPNGRTNRRTNVSNERAEQIRSFVRNIQTNEQRTPGPTEIANELGVSKSYASEVLKDLP